MTAIDDIAPAIDLAGRRALVTGAGSGMGRSTSRVLAACGAELIASDIVAETATETAELCRAAGATAHDLWLDVTDDGAVQAEVARIVAERGPIDIAVMCAGVGAFAPIEEVSEADLDAVMAVSLRGTYSVTRAVLPAMRSAGWGRAIGFSSLNGKTPFAELAHYSAAKAAIIGFVQAVGLEVAAEGVTVNCICPGMVDTPLLEADLELMRRDDPAATMDDVRAALGREVPLGRIAQPVEIARTVAFLASDAGAYVTAQAVNVCGGMELH